MMKKEEFKKLMAEVREIDIVDFLRSLGHVPVHETSTYATFKAPYRVDKNPSLRVYKTANRWMDFGIMDRGSDIIDLGKRLYDTEDIFEVIRRIKGLSPIYPKERPAEPARDSRNLYHPFDHVATGELTNRLLLSYLMTRKIDPTVAVRYCREIHYRYNYREYFGIGFQNVQNGYEVRSECFKGCIGPKDISMVIMHEGNPCVAIAEGFMDFLSFLMLAKDDERFPRDTDFIVLNSVVNLKKALPWLARYSTIYCGLDNDDAGRKTTDLLKEAYDGVVDLSAIYNGYKDLNDFLRKKRFCP